MMPAGSIFALAEDAAVVDTGLLEACGSKPSITCEATWNLTHNHWVTRCVDWFVSTPLKVVVILLVTALVSRWARKLITAVLERVARREELTAAALERIGIDSPSSLAVTSPRAKQRGHTLAAVARATVGAAIWTIGVLMVLGVFDINLGPLLAGAGIAGITIGLGSQSLVKDCIAGFFIILEDQLGVGDEADLGQATGTVENVTLRATTLRGADGTLWTVPNGAIVRVGNHSRKWSKAILDVTIWYEADVDAAMELMNRVAAEVCTQPGFAPIVLDPPVVLGIEHLGAEGIVLRVSVRTRPGEQVQLMRALRSALLSAFEASGVALYRPLA